MRDVAIHHEKVVAADDCFHRVGRAAMDGNVFAEQFVVADFERGRLVVEFDMLRTFAKAGAGINDVAAAKSHRAEEIRAGPDDAIVADDDRSVDYRQRADLDILAKLGLWRNHGGGGNSATRRKGHYGTPSPLGGVPRMTPASNP